MRSLACVALAVFLSGCVTRPLPELVTPAEAPAAIRAAQLGLRVAGAATSQRTGGMSELIAGALGAVLPSIWAIERTLAARRNKRNGGSAPGSPTARREITPCQSAS